MCLVVIAISPAHPFAQNSLPQVTRQERRVAGSAFTITAELYFRWRFSEWGTVLTITLKRRSNFFPFLPLPVAFFLS